MSKIKFLSFLLFAAVTLFSCAKKDVVPSTTLMDTPTAIAQYDASNYGIYKGVFVGSSGIIVIDISNQGKILATLIIEGKTYAYTTTQTILPNQVTSLTFVNGNDHFNFSVASNGTNPTITNLVISGHVDPAIMVVKETSLAIVKCYEGTFSGGDNGIFNAVIFNNKLKALVKSTTANSNFIAEGTVVNNVTISAGSVSSGSTFSGMLSGNTFTGTWNDTQAVLKGTFTGTRTY
ncbi:MAG: hypothetical protein K2Q21_01985 [Chitinophagaceae bacterium]|nr:hypothetical protein [Chitinophagaceae bacterium]